MPSLPTPFPPTRPPGAAARALRRARAAAWWLCGLVAASAVAAAAGEPRPHDPIEAAVPFVHAFRDADGLPQNTVHSIALDADGYLWAGTQDGAARYDGRRWETVEFPDGQPAGPIRALVATSDRALWFGTQEAGLFRLANGVWRRFAPSPESYPTPRVNALLATVDGARTTVWLGLHDGGLAAFDGDSWRRWSIADGLPSDRVWDLLEVDDADGRALWLATSNGLARLRLAGGLVEPMVATIGVSFSSLAVQVADPGRARVLGGSYGGGLFRRETDGRWRRFDAADGLPSMFVTDLEPDPDDEGTVWIGTDGGGLAEITGDDLSAVDLGPEFESRAVYKILETRAEQGASAVWVGTRNNGLLRMSEGLWRVVHPIAGTSTAVSALLISEGRSGGRELWTGLDGRGLARWSDGRWSYFDRGSGALGNDTVQALGETRHLPGGRRLWAGTRTGGLSEWDGSRWRRHDRASGALPNDLVQTLTEVPAPEGARLWVGTREGIAQFDGARWYLPPASEGWPSSSILAVVASAPGDGAGPATVWIGSSTGLYRWRDGALRHWGIEDGLQNDSVLSLHLRRKPSGSTTLWIGTEGGGIAWLDAVADEPRPAAPPGNLLPRMPNRVIHAIVEDGQRRVYLATNRGVVRLTEEAGGDRFGLELFTTQHGLPLNQGMRGAAEVDGDGRVWIGTVGGVAVLEPGSERIDRTRKRMQLSFRRMSSPAERLDSGVELDYGDGPLVFRYVLLSFLGEPLTLYRTQLVGREREPSGWSTATEREVGELPPGDYLFRAWGRDGSGNVSLPVEVAFRVRPAFWQRSWVRWSALALFLGLVALYGRRRTRRHEKREQELEELVAARTRRLERANEMLSELSYIDSLTSVPNRRRFDEILEAEWKRGIRTRVPLSVIMVDIDHFKPFNDTFGHQKGDERLRQVAVALADTLPRAGDVLARYGGEEFAAVLPSTDAGGAMVVAEMLRQSVAARNLPHGAPGVPPTITISCGVATVVPELALDSQGLVIAADLALYDAKRAGRNRVARRDLDGASLG